MLIELSLVKYMFFVTESVIKDQKHTSEEEQTQHSGRNNKRPFVSKYLNLHCILFVVSTIMFQRSNQVKYLVYVLELVHQMCFFKNNIVIYSLKHILVCAVGGSWL